MKDINIVDDKKRSEIRLTREKIGVNPSLKDKEKPHQTPTDTNTLAQKVLALGLCGIVKCR